MGGGAVVFNCIRLSLLKVQLTQMLELKRCQALAGSHRLVGAALGLGGVPPAALQLVQFAGLGQTQDSVRERRREG